MTTALKRQPIPFGNYLLLDRINIGGMAEVWRGKQLGASGFERLVAIKRILPNIAEDEEFITMFIDEAKITVQLTHANVAQVYELGHIQSNYFISMEYIAGKDMRAVFDRCRKKGEPAPVPLTCYVLAKMCEGLDYAHRKKDGMGRDMNIVHRDVSPQNILCSYEGEVKVIDFGIAKAAGKATKTQAGILKGKFAYMSPEQIRGLPLDRRSDVFAIGICLYEMLTGERLFVGDSDFSVLEKVRKAEVTPPSHFNKRVPEALEKIVLKALAKDVEERYQYASEVADDLQRFLITSDSIFSRKDLMQYMKSTFAEDVEREKARTQEYAEIVPPDGMIPAMGSGQSPARARPIPSAAPPFLSQASVPHHTNLAPSAGAPPVLMPTTGGVPFNMKGTVPFVAPPPGLDGIRRTPSLTSLPKLTAAAPMLSNQQEDGGGATMLVDGDAYLKEPATGPQGATPEPEYSPPSESEHTAITAPPSLAALESLTAPTAPSPAALPSEPATLAMSPSRGAPRASRPNIPQLRPSPSPDLAQTAEGRRPSRQVGRAPTPAAPAPARARADPTTLPGSVLAGLDRKQVLLFGGIGALVAILMATGIIFALNRQPATGWIVVYVPAELDSKAHIVINGRDEDTSKLQNHLLMKQLPAGTAVVLVTAEGYEPYTDSVTVKEGRAVAQVRAVLKRTQDTVELLIALDPDQAEIKLDGQVVKREGDKNGIYVGQLPVGQEQRLEVRRAGFKKFEQKIAAPGGGKPLHLNVKLQPLEYPLTVASDPRGANVYVNGRDMGQTPTTVTVGGGVTSLVLKKKCYDELELKVKLPDSPGSAPIPLTGSLKKQPGCH